MKAFVLIIDSRVYITLDITNKEESKTLLDSIAGRMYDYDKKIHEWLNHSYLRITLMVCINKKITTKKKLIKLTKKEVFKWGRLYIEPGNDTDIYDYTVDLK